MATTKAKIDLAVLNQTEHWTTARGETLALTEMDRGHRENTIRYLERNAERFGVKVSLARTMGAGNVFTNGGHMPVVVGLDENGNDIEVMQCIPVHDDLRAAEDEYCLEPMEDPVGWMRRTPLYRRLVELTPPLDDPTDDRIF